MDSGLNTDGLLENLVDDGTIEDSPIVNGESCASKAARTSGNIGNNVPNERGFAFIENNMPRRPRTAFSTPSKSATARSVFDAFSALNTEFTDIQCFQRKLNGEVVVTFKSETAKERFLSFNSLKLGSENYALQDVDKPLTFLTIYDAPFELSDLAIIKRLAPYCEVLHYRRGKHSYAPAIYNGFRYYRVRVFKPIPSFLRFGKFQIFLRHNGQVPTCRKCNCSGHFANGCPNKICFNCEGIGHEASECVNAPFYAVFVKRKATWGSIVITLGSFHSLTVPKPMKRMK